ncbi:hypothetical protein GCM10011506_09540 [Marivirga lumbricoides]|uniref:SCP domain-containing protein n=1 Tax=Marivirga lumbricoides TaxID=1046115 RepID=A0ABQ1LLB8_9BACT|nr:hypothetical protein GCM10011506_09540 [Marivirga lumbricoides]
MKKNIIVLLLTITVFSCDKNDDPQPSTVEDEVLSLINDHRRSLGLANLELNTVIMEEARAHSCQMAEGSVPFGHQGFGDRVKRINEKIDGGASAENVANGYPTPQSVVAGWLNSSGHKKNIEGNYNLTGIGICEKENGTLYYTQIFIKK